MKHPLRKIRYLFLAVLILFLFSPAAWAEDSSTKLASLHFDIALQADGSAWITETREIVFAGDHLFTRYGGSNAFAGPRAFTDWQVSLDGTPLPQLDAPDHENRPENTFAVEDTDGGNAVYIYFRQQGSGTRVFRISYCVENAVKLYADVGEFSWNLTGEAEMSDIGALSATLTVPESVPAEEFLIWAHGLLNGRFEKQPDGSAALQVANVPPGTIVDIRCTLPADHLTGGWAQEGEALGRILAEEQALADSANAKREEEARAQAERDAYQAERDAYWAARNAWAADHPTMNSIQNYCEWFYQIFRYVFTIPAFVASLGALVFVLTAFVSRLLRRPNKLRHTPAQSPQYCRDLPDERPAPAVDRLVHFYDGKSSISRQIPATLLELNLKDLVQFQTVDGDVVLLLNAQPGRKLFPSSTPQETGEQPQAPGYQEILWGFLLSAADGSGQISMKDLNQYIQDNQEAAWDFRIRFERAVSREHGEWVKTQTVKRPFLGGSSLQLLFPVAVGILAVLAGIFSGLYDGIDLVGSLLCGLIALVVMTLMLLPYRLGRKLGQGRCVILDQQAEDDLALWQAFGRYLDDFTTFEDKELPEFSVWREYMAYAVAMGRGQKVAEALSLRYPEAVPTEVDAMSDEMYRWLWNMALYDAMDAIGRDVAAASQPSAPASDADSSSDNWSSGSGDGGGFSDSGGGSDSGSSGSFVD